MALVFLTSVAWAASPTEAPSPAPSVPQSVSLENSSLLRKNVDFWIRIYTQYTTRQGIIHDAKYIDHIYEVMDLGEGKSRNTRGVKEAKRKWRKLLLSVHHKQKSPDQMDSEERRIYDMFADVQDPNKFLAAAHRKRLRFQLGQKNRFLEGLYESGRYFPVMEEIFRREGLPVELTRLPFVESSFNVKARSKVGASGIWQFMRSTGKLYLRINDSVDERNDPIRATEAAAKLLRQNFESLKTWPLAVTAYNHGRQGMMRAVRRAGTDDLEDLVAEYRSRRFGFASINFYAELLAAIEVEKNAVRYFGKVDRAAPVAFFETELPDSIGFKDLTRFLKLEPEVVRELNPGLSDLVFKGRKKIPARYRLRLPFDGKGEKETAAKRFLVGYEQIPDLFKQKGKTRASYGKALKQRKRRN